MNAISRCKQGRPSRRLLPLHWDHDLRSAGDHGRRLLRPSRSRAALSLEIKMLAIVAVMYPKIATE